MFDFVEEAFNQMAFLVNKPIALAYFVAVAARRNGGFPIPRYDGLDERIAVIAFVADKRTRPAGVSANKVSACPISLACPPVSTNSSMHLLR